MSYIAKAISDEEKLISLVRPHWIYPLMGFLWLMFFVVWGITLDHFFEPHFEPYTLNFILDLKIAYITGSLTPISFIFTIVGIFTFWPYFMIYISSEIGLTSERIIYKTGLLFVEIDQVDLEDIRAEHVYHGLLGWVFGYGKIRLDCRFINDVRLVAISNPYRFVRASHNARLKHPSIEYDDDEFAANLVHIAQKQKENRPRTRAQNLKNIIKANFRKSA